MITYPSQARLLHEETFTPVGTEAQSQTAERCFTSFQQASDYASKNAGIYSGQSELYWIPRDYS